MRPWKLGDLVETRVAFGEGLLEAGRRNPKVVVLDADLQRSNRTFAYGEANPGKFYDMGISEADMVSTAAGMASMGFTVFAASFAVFVPGHCYDQIRLMAAYANADIKLVGSSAGLSHGADGATHQALDDVGLMRQLPNMTVIVPADAEEAYQAVLKAVELKGPVYLRFGRYPTPVLYQETDLFEIGKARLLRPGADVAMFANGIMVAKALQAAENLQKSGIDSTVVNISTVKPLDRDAVWAHSRGKQLIVTLEEHSIINGLGSAVAEMLAEAGGTRPLLRIGVNDLFGQSGKPDELLEHYGLSVQAITRRVQAAVTGLSQSGAFAPGTSD
jgi:transketolase